MRKIRVAVNVYGVIGKCIDDATALINKTNDSLGIIHADILKSV